MREGVRLGVERRRRRTDEAKLAILGEVGVNGWTVADVARHHDVTRQHICQWRGEMRRKGLTDVRRLPFPTIRFPATMAGNASRPSYRRMSCKLRTSSGSRHGYSA